MKFRDRNGNEWEKSGLQDKVLGILYQSSYGRMLLKPLLCPFVSKIGGALLDMKWSTCFILPFIKKNQIPMEQYEPTTYQSYNDFFTRKIKKEARPINTDENVLISPSDGKVSVYPIEENGTFCIKHTKYTVESLTKSKKIAKHYKGGTIVILRLTVDDYHRYCYPAAGKKSRNYTIKGQFHTVNPIANDYYPIYKENTREFTLLKTEKFGTILQMEVGALMVGKISNYVGKATVKRGEEKGRFEFGGSTVVLLLEKDKVAIDDELFINTKEGYETVVRMGEKIGVCIEKQ